MSLQTSALFTICLLMVATSFCRGDMTESLHNPDRPKNLSPEVINLKGTLENPERQERDLQGLLQNPDHKERDLEGALENTGEAHQEKDLLKSPLSEADQLNNLRNKDRQARGIFKPQTFTVFMEKKSLVTEISPSSCVVVEPSLPPCRHVRQIRIEPTATQPILHTQAPMLRLDKDHSSTLQTMGAAEGRFFWRLSGSQPPTPVHQAKEKVGTVNEPEKKRPWEGWFNFNDDVTVTQTIVHHVTQRIEDPNTVVKFSVKGCQPSRLPFDLPKCNETALADSRTDETVESASISKDIHYVPV